MAAVSVIIIILDVDMRKPPFFEHKDLLLFVVL